MAGLDVTLVDLLLVPVLAAVLGVCLLIILASLPGAALFFALLGGGYHFGLFV
jgi:hypothetical protein